MLPVLEGAAIPPVDSHPVISTNTQINQINQSNKTIINLRWTNLDPTRLEVYFLRHCYENEGTHRAAIEQWGKQMQP